VSNPNKPGPPPDDWTKTTPNINLPDNITGGSGNAGGGGEPDWAKTNYRIPIHQANPDDFGKTVTNIKPIDTNRQPDFGKTMYPGAAAQPPSGDWGATQANVNIPASDFGSSPSDWGPGPDKTTPYFQLPEAERAKYQQLPPTPAEQAAQEQQAKAAKGGIPGWVWVVAGLMVMFFFAVAVLGLVYFFILRDTSFKVTIKGAPAGSDILIDDKLLSVSNEDGDSEIGNLSPGRKTITIRHPTYTCQPIQVEGGRGVNPEPVYARCQAQVARADDDCANIQIGEEDKAERCYNAALEALPNPFTPEQLVKALNILIINFETGSSQIMPKRVQAIKKGAEYIKRLPANVMLEIGGHTDSTGQPGTNQPLSEARANSVKDMLVKSGVNATILRTKGYGATVPRAGVDGNSELGKFLNRRIEYSIVK
jgi:outer membrane protein OmpA-like peptidoglycan-associated protein